MFVILKTSSTLLPPRGVTRAVQLTPYNPGGAALNRMQKNYLKKPPNIKAVFGFFRKNKYFCRNFDSDIDCEKKYEPNACYSRRKPRAAGAGH